MSRETLGELEDLDRLETLGRIIKNASLCGLGQTVPNPVTSTLRYFRDEYIAHIVEKRCPANSCEALITTTCSSACPAHVNIPEYIGLIAVGKYQEALDTIRRRNPLPSVCGRACDHPCELYCRRGDVDDPVAIKELKRFVSDRITDPGNPPQWKGPRKGRVAIVGSGPAGLTAAYFLATMGREVKVFEALDIIGGLLAVDIPQYRLPGEVLERDIEYIRRAGVEIVTGSKVSSVKQLRDDGYDAVFVATGAHKSTSLGIPGEEMSGVVDALRFLREALRGDISKIEGRVVVIGGGNAAIDAARTAFRLGASSVTILYRRTREEMPAIASEIEDALSEGVALRQLVAPIAIKGDEHVRMVCCQEMILGEADDNGRRRPVPLPDSSIEIETDYVIAAVGQTPELDFAQEDGSLIVSRGRIETEVMTQKSGEDGVFAGGDAVTGPATIIDAIAAGQRAARAIDIYLGGKGELLPDTLLAPQIKPDEEMADKPRQRVCHLSQSARVGSFAEVVEGFTEENACIEACRCLRCDLEHNIDD